MHVQKIYAAMPLAMMAQPQKQQVKTQENAKNMTNPFNEEASSKASMIARNYFLGAQKVNPVFTGFPCSTSNFRVKELEDMPCTCCGRPMMTNKQVDEFSMKAGRAAGKELNQILDDNMDYFRAEEKAIVHYIQKQLKGMPDATLTTAISRTGADAGQILKDEQIDVIKRTSEKSKELLGEENPIQSLCERELKTTFGVGLDRKKQKSSGSFNRTNFLSNIVDLEKKKGIKHENIHKVLDVAVQLPESEKIISKMLTTYGLGNSDERFAHRLIQKAVVTAEHIHPKSKGGPNATNNYMGECQECNGSRGNMSYDEWMKRYPNMPDNIQVHADAVTEEIIKGKIGGNYDDYPVDLKSAVESETQGKVVLTVKNPEQINQVREERGLSKPTPDAKEKANAAGAYQGSYHGIPESQKSGKSGKKHHHVVRFPETTQTTAEQPKKEEKAA